VAQVTSTIRLGTFVLNNDLRHPAVVAQDLASIDVLSGGRLEIGIGAGWNIDEYRAAGLSYDRFAMRFARMTEAVAVLKGLLGDGAFSFSGSHYTIAEMDGRPKPLQKPHPPILIGSGGRTGLEFAARNADIVGLAPRLPRPGQPDVASLMLAATAEKVEWVRNAAGERFDQLELNTYGSIGPAHVTDDALTAARALAERLGGRYGVEVSAEDVLDSPHVFIGSVQQLVDKCLMLRERFGISYFLPLGDLTEFAPVVERLVGR
jgi:probable F420-dependent oxidoreductase